MLQWVMLGKGGLGKGALGKGRLGKRCLPPGGVDGSCCGTDFICCRGNFPSVFDSCISAYCNHLCYCTRLSSVSLKLGCAQKTERGTQTLRKEEESRDLGFSISRCFFFTARGRCAAWRNLRMLVTEVELQVFSCEAIT